MKYLMRACTAIVAVLAVAACQPAERAEEAAEMEAAAAPEPGTPEYTAYNAMSAAPQALASAATIMDWPEAEGGEPTVVREGTNGWTCFPDMPSTPANDPACVDEASLAWFQAWMSHTEPNLAHPGLGYMLQGGADASNTDPFATEPAPGEEWNQEPPHIMLFPAKGTDLSAFSTDPQNGGPWVMYGGTPYEHLMVPVQ